MTREMRNKQNKWGVNDMALVKITPPTAPKTSVRQNFQINTAPLHTELNPDATSRPLGKREGWHQQSTYLKVQSFADISKIYLSYRYHISQIRDIRFTASDSIYSSSSVYRAWGVRSHPHYVLHATSQISLE